MSGRVSASAKIEYSTKKGFRTNKFIIIIIIMTMIIGQLIYQQAINVQHDSQLSEEFNASPQNDSFAYALKSITICYASASFFWIQKKLLHSQTDCESLSLAWSLKQYNNKLLTKLHYL